MQFVMLLEQAFCIDLVTVKNKPPEKEKNL